MSPQNLLPVLALLAASASASAVQSLQPEQSAAIGRRAELRVLEGRAVVLHEGALETLYAGAESLRLPGPVHLEVPAGARVRVAWMGEASLLLSGPGAIQWDELPAGSGLEEPWRLGPLRWRVFSLGRLDVEVRRGRPLCFLPEHWSARLEVSALSLQGLANGLIEVHQRAGRPQPWTWRGDPNRARPPVRLQAGDRARLGRPDESRLPHDHAALVPGWRRVAWPWGQRAMSAPPEPGPELERVSQGIEAARDPLPAGPVKQPAPEATSEPPESAAEPETLPEPETKPVGEGVRESEDRGESPQEEDGDSGGASSSKP